MNKDLCQHFHQGWSCSPALALILDNSFLPKYLWCLLSFCPSGGIQRELVWVILGPLRKSAWDSDSTPLTQPQCLLVYSQKFWDFSSWHWTPCLGPRMGLGPLIPLVRYHSWFLSATHGYRTACSISPPILLVSIWPFLYIFSYRISIELDFRCSEWWLFCSLHCNFDVLVGGLGYSFTYTAILTKTILSIIFWGENYIRTYILPWIQQYFTWFYILLVTPMIFDFMYI